MKKILTRAMLVLLAFLAILGAGIYAFLQFPEFGKLPDGEALERIKKSPHYSNGRFNNLIDTPQLTEGVGYPSMLVDYFFSSESRLKPATPLPAVKTDLSAIAADQDGIVWFGHSSFFMQMNGIRILVDPVFSDYASPVSFSTRAFDTAVRYTPEDMPDIDYLIISHDHWDHLDYRTVTALKNRIGKVICGLGVGSHFRYWGFAPEKIIEGDWFETLEPEQDFVVHVLPARHFSGRGLRQNGTLWAAYVLETPGRRVFYSGDSGYGPHFTDIGRHFGEFDMAIMSNGQHDVLWKYIHMTPEEVMQATEDLQARALLPVHAGRFSIARHAWDEPFKRIAAASQGKNIRLITPMIGEWVNMAGQEHVSVHWWEGIE